MTDGPVVCDASPLIALEQIGQLTLLQKLFDHILIPNAVAHEVSPSVSLPTWVTVFPVSKPFIPIIQAAPLGPGETEAISLAFELKAYLLILDERPGRRLAEELGLMVIGTLGVLVACKKHGHIKLVRPFMEELMQHDFRISRSLYRLVIDTANE